MGSTDGRHVWCRRLTDNKVYKDTRKREMGAQNFRLLISRVCPISLGEGRELGRLLTCRNRATSYLETHLLQD